MAHHSSEDPLGREPGLLKQFRKLIKDPALASLEERMFGPTDLYPEGKFSRQDEGELRFGVTQQNGKVIVDFGTPVHSLGLTKAQACDLGRLLITRAGYKLHIEID